MNRIQPPAYALKFFRWFCHAELVDSIEGDLTELYYDRLKKYGKRRADLNFLRDVLLLFRPGIIRSFRYRYPTNQYDMFRNYFIVAWRSLLRQRMYSFIKIGGFAVGIAACMLIGLYVLDELSYDNQYPNANRIYRVVGVIERDGEIHKDVWMPPPFAEALKNDYPEVEKVARINPTVLFGGGENEVRISDQLESFHEEGFVFADQSLLDMLEIPMVEGERSKALAQPNTIVITRSRAEKYFPGESALGKTLIINNDEKQEYTIGGVIDDFHNSQFKFQFLITLTDKEFWPGEQEHWDTSNYPTYVLLQKDVDPQQFARKMYSMVETYWLPILKESGIPNIEELLKSVYFELQPLKDVHLYSSNISDESQHGDIRMVWLFGTVAVFILLIASFNFINLSTARSANRAREVGIRKVVGSQRSNLVNQFLSESILYSAVSFVIALTLVQLTLPAFNQLTNKQMQMPWLAWWLFPGIIIAVLLVGIFSGLYPSFYLSSFRPLQILKGNLALGARTSVARSTLVVIQFAISIILIVSTIVINMQMNFIINKDLGFTKEKVVLIRGTRVLGDQVKPFKEELKNVAGVQSAAIGDYLPIEGTTRNGNTFKLPGVAMEGVIGERWIVDNDYINTMDMEIVEGRNFDPDISTDDQATIINEKMVRDLGLKDPIGKLITNGDISWTVIGVVKDFNFESLRSQIAPLSMMRGSSAGIISIRLTKGDVSSPLDEITRIWKRFSPHQALRYSFLDYAYLHMYDDVRRTKAVFINFSVLGVIVACLGLFGLSAFMAEQRRKEISIRKVLGASVDNLVRLLTMNFVKLVVISFVVAVPLAAWLMNLWLSDYAYKTRIGWEPFTLAGAMALMVAILTVGYQALKASLVNPVVNLKAE